MTAHHTPGPWETSKVCRTIYVEARLGFGMMQEVAACGPTEGAGEQEANAALIARAPTLLAENDRLRALLERTISLLGDGGDIQTLPSDLAQDIRAALAGEA